MKILVFGGTGYIGNRLIALLIEKGHEIGNVSRKLYADPNAINYNINDDVDIIIDKFGPDVVIYLSACFDNKNIKDIVKINIELPIRIMNKLTKTSNSTFIYIGSYWQFGDLSLPDIPIDLYSAAKKSLTAFINYFNAYTDLKCKEIILYGTYGDHDGRGKLLDYLIDSAVSGKNIKLTEGHQLLNLSPIDEVCKEIYNQAIGEPNIKVQVLSKVNYSPRQLVAMINEIKAINVEFGVVPYRTVELMTPYLNKEYKCIYIEDNIKEYIYKRIMKS